MEEEFGTVFDSYVRWKKDSAWVERERGLGTRDTFQQRHLNGDRHRPAREELLRTLAGSVFWTPWAA